MLKFNAVSLTIVLSENNITFHDLLETADRVNKTHNVLHVEVGDEDPEYGAVEVVLFRTDGKMPNVKGAMELIDLFNSAFTTRKVQL
jgi:hypothetical protein